LRTAGVRDPLVSPRRQLSIGTANKSACQGAVRYLKANEKAAAAGDSTKEFEIRVAELGETHVVVRP
jgi:hypothetical protein